jgi:hypothetical protein
MISSPDIVSSVLVLIIFLKRGTCRATAAVSFELHFESWVDVSLHQKKAAGYRLADVELKSEGWRAHG